MFSVRLVSLHSDSEQAVAAAAVQNKQMRDLTIGVLEMLQIVSFLDRFNRNLQMLNSKFGLR